jgi:hypothetical protein
METIDLVMDVEDAFGIAIPNDVAPEIATVGRLHETVLQLLRAKGDARVAVAAGSGNRRVAKGGRDRGQLCPTTRNHNSRGTGSTLTDVPAPADL